ncbi:uncharacterized protein [Eucyclogobius newberryi]|uniref:uncharacterized protein n=1 Tax=Eucyclogobius newberryi TaxID=166745 RepID=UPI003B59B282
MKTAAAKNTSSLSKSFHKSGLFEMPSTLQENLTSAIHGAFEVAVEIAVLEVTKLISLAAEDMFDEMRRENETLKEELQKAHSVIETVCGKVENSGAKVCQLVQNDNSASSGAGDLNREGTFSAALQRLEDQEEEDGDDDDDDGDSSQEDTVSDSCEQDNSLTSDCVEVQQIPNTLKQSHDTETNKEMSLYCGVKVERNEAQPCMCEEDEDHSPQADSFPDNCAPRHVKVKLEKPEGETIASNYLVDSCKEEAISQLQAEILEEWTPGGSHFEREEQHVTLSALSQAFGHPSDVDFHSDPALESSSVTASDFPLHVTDQAHSREHRPPQIYGSPVRRNQGIPKLNLHGCRLCGQTFPLPSLLRRHYGQCQQKLNQRVHVPPVGGKRTKLQLYPPGCSPFRCPECNREFNRMENLKTHLRIHTGERPFKCSVCSTSFRHSGALTRHFRIHTGEKPYVCGLCGKSFRNCGGLKFHQRSHGKELRS